MLGTVPADARLAISTLGLPSTLQDTVLAESVASGSTLLPAPNGNALVASRDGVMTDSLSAVANAASTGAAGPLSVTTCGIYFSTLHTRIVRGSVNAVPTVELFATVYPGKRLGCPGSKG